MCQMILLRKATAFSKVLSHCAGRGQFRPPASFFSTQGRRSPTPSARTLGGRRRKQPDDVADDSARISGRARRGGKQRIAARAEPARHIVVPDAGMTPSQLAALANASVDAVWRCAAELEGSVTDTTTVMAPALIELVVEEMDLRLVLRPQRVPFPSQRKAKRTGDQYPRRMPIVTVMGHVDHGKTSLLDALRKSNVAEREVGGITQSVAAFKVPIGLAAALDSSDGGHAEEQQFATFIDTPGHEAFTAMREHGTVGTDIVVLVVAADDGVMPQTVEAIDLARAAGVPIVVAVNKCDRDGARPDRVRYQLLELANLNTEQLGGDTQCVDISAVTGLNLKELLDSIILQSDMLDLRADIEAPAEAICLESRSDRSLGSVATVVVRWGTLRVGDSLVFRSSTALSGELHGRVRSLLDSGSSTCREACPGNAVGLVGLRSAVAPGAEMIVVPSEKAAKALSHSMVARNAEAMATLEMANAVEKERAAAALQRSHLSQTDGDASGTVQAVGGSGPEEDGEEFAEQVPAVNVVIKGDVQGSADAVAQCVQALSTPLSPIRVLSSGVGDVSDADVQLASATSKVKGNHDDAVIIAFNVRVVESAKRHARRAGLDVLSHSLIYHLEDELEARLSRGVKSRESTEELLGKASVVRVFDGGAIAGCTVDDGLIAAGADGRVLRFPTDGSGSSAREEIYTGTIESVKHFAKSVRSVSKGSECGVGFAGWSKFAPGDVIESVRITKGAA